MQNMNSYYSEYGEDRWIAENLTIPKSGVFVEVGALNGVGGSNSLWFERQGWTGLCIEADPRMWEGLLQRRKCRKFFGAVGSNPSMEFEVHQQIGWSGFGRGGTKISVPVLPLSNVLDAYGIDRIDILSIDVEGAELDVWRSGSFGGSRSFPQIVIVEFETAGLPSAEKELMSTFCGSAGSYMLRHRTTSNLILELSIANGIKAMEKAAA
jgi:FkbM family methyltransferase